MYGNINVNRLFQNALREYYIRLHIRRVVIVN